MSPFPKLNLSLPGGKTLAVDRPLIMGVLNATPDSFSDGGEFADVDSRVTRARQMLQEGADILDVGGESAVTNRPAVAVEEEIERVCPLIVRLVGELGATVSVDTYKPAVAKAAVQAGAVIVNDTSGLRDMELAQICADSGAGLVVMHTRAAPKKKIENPDYKDVVEDVVTFLTEKMEIAVGLGVDSDQIILDPGPDFAKKPSQTVETLRALPELHKLGRPLLLALSRKDFIGAINKTMPRARGAGTLAAVGYCLERGGQIYRVHEVEATKQYIDVWLALREREGVSEDLILEEHLRREITLK